MAIETINIGSYANDGTGDDLRTAFEKVNANFTLLETGVTGAVNLGTGANVFAQKTSTDLEFKTLTSNNNSVIITETDTEINLVATPSLIVDTDPMLGGDLDMQGHRAYNGNVETTVYGYDVPSIAGMVQLLIESGQFNLDFNGNLGTQDGFSVLSPSSATLDFNGTGNINFIDSAFANINLDLGTF